MEHIPQPEAQLFEKDSTKSWEYETRSLDVNVARIQISGRYPEEGFTVNREVDSIVHIINGSGIIGAKDGSRVELASHDQLHIAKAEAYFFEGELELLYCATPKWTPEQTERID